MRRSFLVITSLIIIASFGFGETVVSVIGASTQNASPIAPLEINLENTSAVGGLQFSLKDIPNELSVAAVVPAGRAAAEPYDDFGADGNANTNDFGEGDNQYTPGEPYTDVNGNEVWDGDFSVEFNDRDSTVSVLIFDASGNSIIPGNGPICTILFSVPATVSDEIIELKFHEILNADPQFLLVVTDPDGTALNTTWLNGLLTVGGIEVRLSGGGGTPGTLSAVMMIEMNNLLTPVKGLQFNIVDDVDYLTIETVQGVGRGSDFTFVGNEVNGQSLILGVNLNGQEIPAGSGAVLEVQFMIAANAPMGDLSVSITDLIVATQGGLPLPSNGEDYVFTLTTGVDDEAELPTAFELKQNYPNPFNPTTTISYSVPEASEIQVGIFNLLGQEIRSLSNGEHQPGVYSTMWDGLNQNGVRVESGIYIYRMSSSAGFSATKKLVMLK
ncbi:MAG: T9SS type A sorting domain-containing protein, partial [FCB group bacterium]|nr:T9SS type A sorting domain-containing protein [FCB group bacterium]MBL7027050.1 T9SS type A sorting domain-containing protein [Candidatus Neomarinimicrobiota bacterium]MBL7123032.1 T9SS type A sorting domain-containing protein [Candidatus Neomarinimicrobiota bacterium]